MDLLLDVNVAVDVCARRQPFYQEAELAIAKCQCEGGRIWLYAGSVQTLEYVTRQELQGQQPVNAPPLSAKQLGRQARHLLEAFAADKHWLAALADEGSVFASEDPEDEQLIVRGRLQPARRALGPWYKPPASSRLLFQSAASPPIVNPPASSWWWLSRALDRFPPDAIKLLTHDQGLIDAYPDRTMTPARYCQRPMDKVPLPFIDLPAQQDRIRPDLERGIHRVLHHGQYIMGPEIAELEAALAAYVGVKHGITVASGTDSLEIALRALGVGPGDEVITVPFTWISSAEVIGLVGARPVFVDIEPASFNIDVTRIEAAITPRTQAILPVSLFGQMPDYGAINAIAARHGLPVIEDAAQSFGATQHGRRSGGVTTVGSTSFFPAKPLGCYGDGGTLFTDDDELAEKMRAIRTHGGMRRHHHPHLGMNGRFDTLQAAVLLAKWPHFEREVEARSRIGVCYTERLQDGCVTPRVLPGNTHVYAQYTIRVADRERVAEALKTQGIPTAVYYPQCLHEQPVFAGLGYRWGDFPEAERASREVLSLPMHPWLTEREQEPVVAALRAVVG